MYAVGFLKFLKRDNKQDLTSLDLPPEPPKLEGFDDNLPDLPDFPEISAHEPDNADNDFMFDFPEDKKADFGEEKMPEMPAFPDMEKIISPVNPTPMPAFAPVPARISPPQSEETSWQEEPQQVQAMPEPDYEPPRRIFHHERRALDRSRKEVYIRVDKFKMALDGIGMIRNSLRKSDEALLKLESIKNSKDRSFDKVKSSLEDLQKKIIFIDKTLFKGD